MRQKLDIDGVSEFADACISSIVGLIIIGGEQAYNGWNSRPPYSQYRILTEKEGLTWSPKVLRAYEKFWLISYWSAKGAKRVSTCL